MNSMNLAKDERKWGYTRRACLYVEMPMCISDFAITRFVLIFLKFRKERRSSCPFFHHEVRYMVKTLSTVVNQNSAKWFRSELSELRMITVRAIRGHVAISDAFLDQ